MCFRCRSMQRGSKSMATAIWTTCCPLSPEIWRRCWDTSKPSQANHWATGGFDHEDWRSMNVVRSRSIWKSEGGSPLQVTSFASRIPCVGHVRLCHKWPSSMAGVPRLQGIYLPWKRHVRQKQNDKINRCLVSLILDDVRCQTPNVADRWQTDWIRKRSLRSWPCSHSGAWEMCVIETLGIESMFSKIIEHKWT